MVIISLVLVIIDLDKIFLLFFEAFIVILITIILNKHSQLISPTILFDDPPLKKSTLAIESK